MCRDLSRATPKSKTAEHRVKNKRKHQKSKSKKTKEKRIDASSTEMRPQGQIIPNSSSRDPTLLIADPILTVHCLSLFHPLNLIHTLG